MQGVPEQFPFEKDRAQFRHLLQLPGVELYQAHIDRYAFEPHAHDAFGIGTVEAYVTSASSELFFAKLRDSQLTTGRCTCCVLLKLGCPLQIQQQYYFAINLRLRVSP